MNGNIRAERSLTRRRRRSVTLLDFFLLPFSLPLVSIVSPLFLSRLAVACYAREARFAVRCVALRCTHMRAYGEYMRGRENWLSSRSLVQTAQEAIRNIIPAIANTHRRSRYNGGRVIGITIHRAHLPPSCRRKDSIIAFRRYFLRLGSCPSSPFLPSLVS